MFYENTLGTIEMIILVVLKSFVYSILDLLIIYINVNYRLAPQYQFPASIEDICHALLWTRDNIRRFGGDAGRLLAADRT